MIMTVMMMHMLMMRKYCSCQGFVCRSTMKMMMILACILDDGGEEDVITPPPPTSSPPHPLHPPNQGSHKTAKPCQNLHGAH